MYIYVYTLRIDNIDSASARTVQQMEPRTEAMSPSFSLHPSIHLICLFVFVHMSMYLCIYIYIYSLYPNGKEVQ